MSLTQLRRRPAQRVEDLWDAHFRDPAAALRTRAGAARRATSSSTARPRVGASSRSVTTICSSRVRPTEAREWLARAQAQFAVLRDRRGELLAETGLRPADDRRGIAGRGARAAAWQSTPEAEELLPPQDRFWVSSTLGAAYFFTDRIDEAIRYLYDSAGDAARDGAVAAAAGGDVEPRRGAGDRRRLRAGARARAGRARAARALQQSAARARRALQPRGVAARPRRGRRLRSRQRRAMLDVATGEPGLPPQNHYCAVAAETYALHVADDAARCVAIAKAIHDRYPGGFNEVHYRWGAAVAAAHGPGRRRDRGAGERRRGRRAVKHAPTLCKAHERLAERYAAPAASRRPSGTSSSSSPRRRSGSRSRASAKYYLLKVQHELQHARVELDRADRQRQETDRAQPAARAAQRRAAAQGPRDRDAAGAARRRGDARPADAAVQSPLPRRRDAGAARHRRTPRRAARARADRPRPLQGINDRFGHPAGDPVLVRIGALFAARCAPPTSSAATAARNSASCFPIPTAPARRRRCRRSRRACASSPIRWEGHAIDGFTFSAGVAVLSGARPHVLGARRECRPRALRSEGRRSRPHADGGRHAPAPGPHVPTSLRRLNADSRRRSPRARRARRVSAGWSC